MLAVPNGVRLEILNKLWAVSQIDSIRELQAVAHVFTSYAPENYEFAEVVQLRLERGGFPVWIDADQGEIAHETMVAKNWRQEIDDAIRASFAMIAIVTLRLARLNSR
jgi:TIR domain